MFRILAAPELLILSKGLPPPLWVLPDLIDSSSAGDVLVLLAEVDFACDVAAEGGGGVVVMIEDVEGVEAGCVVDNVVLCFAEGEGVAELVVLVLAALAVLGVAALVVVAVVVESGVVLVRNVDCNVGIGIGIMDMVVLAVAGNPVVVVTTATLHSNWIALPSLNSPTMLVSNTSAAWQLLATSALTCTSPARQAFEHTAFWKSSKVHPGIGCM